MQDSGFRQFWDEYHKTTRQDKRYVSKARKEWNKFPADEHCRAVGNIMEYYMHLENTKFCLGAVNYLSYKAFDNEYEY